MSELQIALIAFGALLVAAVWGFNLWQERKHRRRAAEMLPAHDRAAPDVLMRGREEERAEPTTPIAAVPQEPTFRADEPALAATEETEETAEAAEPAPLPAAPPLPQEWADGRADCLLRIEFVDAVPVAGIWAEQAQWSRKVDKPLQWLGLDAKSGRWRALLPQDPGAIAQLAVALQLADRKGALGEEALTAFLGGMHVIAQRFSGLVELPEPASVLARAHELDSFCAAVDLQLDLAVVPHAGASQGLAGEKLPAVLSTHDLKREGERYVAADGSGAELFALAGRTAEGTFVASVATQAPASLLLSLDVPRVADGADAFDRMVACARQCAEALGGQLADAHGKPLADATVAAIRERIVDMQARMAQMGIPAGSMRALRLFS
jgi:FtsZ-interacting cell division protein ZipA